MRRDLDIDCDPAALVLAPPDRSQLKEIFRRFEFRGLLTRVDTLDAALPRGADGGRPASRCRGARASSSSRAASATRPTATARPSRGEDGVVVGPRPAARRRRARRARREGAARRRDRRHAARRVPDRARPRVLRARPTSRPSTASSSSRRRRPTRRRPRSCVAAETPRRLVEPLLERLEERGATALYRDDRAAADARARRDGGRRREDRHLPDGRDHRAAARARRRARGAARTSSPARSSCSARPSRSRGSCSRSSA